MLLTTLLRAALRCILPTLLCSSVLAQTSASCPPTAPAPTDEQLQDGLRNAQDRGFLWRITKQGHDSYLFGTVHVARFDWMFPGKSVSAALDASDTFALELDALDPDIQQRLAQGMATLTATPLPAALQQRLQRRMQAECIPAQALSALGPELQIATLLTLAGRRDGLDPAYGVDLFLAGLGHTRNQRVVSLEKPELQVRALQMGSAAETIEFVGSSLDSMDSGQASAVLKRIAQAWADADLDTLTRYESWCDCMKTAADRAAMKRLLDDRNPPLADGIDTLHTSGQRVFAAVGSLHMIGPGGLPARMAQRGYRVERVLYRP